MHSGERPEFEAQVRLLFAGFNVPSSDDRLEAYWLALRGWHLAAFVRVVEYALGERGPDKLPTVAKCREINAHLRTWRHTHDTVTAPEAAYDALHGFAQRCLFQWLRERGGVDEATLARLVAEKNRLLAQFREIAAEETLAADEVRPAMLRAFDRVAA